MSDIENNGLNRRRFLQASAATGAAAGIGASLPLGKTAAAAPKKGGTMRMGKGHGQTTDTLDPGVAENGFTIGMIFGFHSFLTEVGNDGSLQPGLAESWEASADAATWTFKLRKGVTFHNGKTMTSEDVVNSINHHRSEDSTSAAGPLVEPIEDLKADGPDTVVFKLAAGNADFPLILTDYHMPIGPSKDGAFDWRSGAGAGAYKLANFEPGVRADLERNENHWNPDVGHFDAIEQLALVDLNARTTALVSGSVDAIDRLDLKTVGLLGRRPGINIHTVAGTQHYTMPMDTRAAPFNDNNVRLALKYGINREELIEKILFGYGAVGNDHPIGSGQRYFNTDLPQTAFDPDKAKFYLDKAGLTNLSVDLSASEAAFGGAVDAAVLYQNSAKDAGIDVNVVREPNDGYWSDVWMKKPFVLSYWSGRPAEDQMFSTAYSEGAAWNESYWSHERFNKILVEARAELDDNKRREMYWEMQTILNQEGGSVIPMFASYVFATNENVAFTGDFASNWDLDGERWMERWYFA